MLCSKKNIKQFFGLSWKGIITRIVLGIILFIIVTYIHSATWLVQDYQGFGWPFYFYESWGPCPPTTSVCHASNLLALIADVVIWYFVLCLVVFVFKKIKNILVR